MDIYEETHINLIVRLTRAAHDDNIAMKRYVALADALSDILLTIQRHRKIGCLHRIIYMAMLKLGYCIGPFNAKATQALSNKGLIVTKKLIYLIIL